jgi:hypothetical protein
MTPRWSDSVKDRNSEVETHSRILTTGNQIPTKKESDLGTEPLEICGDLEWSLGTGLEQQIEEPPGSRKAPAGLARGAR